MYTAYFGLSELPFSIAPNPDYLFMSERHREALVHLTYGLGETGGFVLLTGEVGTGKTTISRCLMAQLPENTQTAFILNPTLSSQELLATLCDELKIRYRKTGATLKTLTDKIQEKLLKNHQANINTLLIIDEAQHLQAEVLEQLRLLTNLETNTKKLLQVILIGQPELQQLLQRRDLRQLSQRITARYHLLPLSKADVEQYIKHRLAVADCYRSLFNKGAIAMIHKLSQGIPRLINLLCDRSLWIAYGENKSVVDKNTVIKASAEALGEEYKPTPWWQHKGVKITTTLLLLSTALVAGIWWGQEQQVNLHLSKAASDISTIDENPTTAKLAQQTQQPKVKNSPVITGKVNTATTVKQHEEVSPIDKPTKAASPIEESKKPLVLGYIPKERTLAAQKIISAEKEQNSLDNINLEPSEGVSKELLASFQQAIAETSADHDSTQALEPDTTQDFTKVQNISQMPTSLQNALPSLQFQMHIFASDGQGWVRVNGKDIHEGEKIAEHLYLDKILPQQVILRFRGERFAMPALSSW